MRCVAAGVGLLVAAVALAGCASPTSSPAPIDVRVAVDHVSFRVGELVNVTGSATNVATTPYNYIHPGCPPELVRLGVRVAGTTVELPQPAFAGRAGACTETQMQLAPGQAWHANATWDGRDDKGVAVPPGEYTIIAALAGRGPAALFVGQTVVRVLA